LQSNSILYVYHNIVVRRSRLFRHEFRFVKTLQLNLGSNYMSINSFVEVGRGRL